MRTPKPLRRRADRVDYAELPLEQKVERNRDIILRLRQSDRWKWTLLTIWIILFTIASFLGYRANRNLNEQNQERITEIQQSRFEACIGTNSVLTRLLVTAQGSFALTPDAAARFAKLLDIVDPTRCKSTTGQ